MPPKRKRARDGTELPVLPPAGLAELARMDIDATAEFIPRQIGWKVIDKNLDSECTTRDAWLGALGPGFPQLLCAVVRRGDIEGAATLAKLTSSGVSWGTWWNLWDAFCESHPPGMYTAIWDLLPYYIPKKACEHGAHVRSPAFPCCGKAFPAYVAKEAFRVALRADRTGNSSMTRDLIVLYATHGRLDLAARLLAGGWGIHADHAMYGICRAGYCDAYYERVICPFVKGRSRTRRQRSHPFRPSVESVTCGHAEKSFARLQAHGLLNTQTDAMIAMRTVWARENTPNDAQTHVTMVLIYTAHKELCGFLSNSDAYFLTDAIVLFRELRRCELVPLLAAVLPVQDIPEAIVDLVDVVSL